MRFAFFLSILCWVSTSAQVDAPVFSKPVQRADQHFEHRAFATAISQYLRAIDTGTRDAHVCRQLGQCYMSLGNRNGAEPWYAELMMYPGRTEADIRTYAYILRSLGKLDDYTEWMELVMSDPKELSAFRSLLSNLQDLRKTSSHFEVVPLKMNTPADEFAPAWFGNGRVLYSSNEIHMGMISRIDAWTGSGFSDLLLADRGTDGSLTVVGPVEGQLNGPYHEAGVSLMADGKSLVFSRTIFSEDGWGRLELYNATYEGKRSWLPGSPVLEGVWTNEAFHPALSRDGSTLIFASNGSDQDGNADLYISYKSKKGWSTPIPVPGPVNTGGNELFPFIDDSGNLFFASNGHLGMGGLDIFLSRKLKDGSYDEPMNLRSPLNSNWDDFGLIMDVTGRHGYFTSNRAGGAGGDDLYAFNLNGAIEPAPYKLIGRLQDKNGKRLYKEVEVIARAANDPQPQIVKTNFQGDFEFVIDPLTTTWISSELRGYTVISQCIVPASMSTGRVQVRDLWCLPNDEGRVMGHVKIAGTDEVAVGATATLTGVVSRTTEKAITGAAGEFHIPARKGEAHLLRLSLDGFFPRTIEIPAERPLGVFNAGLVVPLELSPRLLNVRTPLRQAFAERAADHYEELRSLAANLISEDGMEITIVPVVTARSAAGDIQIEKAAYSVRQDLIGMGVKAERISVGSPEIGMPGAGVSLQQLGADGSFALYYVLKGR